MKLTEYDNPIVKEKALMLTKNHETIQDKITAAENIETDRMQLHFFL